MSSDTTIRHAGKEKEAPKCSEDEMADSFYPMGTEARCRERIEEHREANVNLLPYPDDLTKVAEALSKQQ